MPPAHQAIAVAASPPGVPSIRWRSVSTIGVIGWCSATACRPRGIQSVGTNALLTYGRVAWMEQAFGALADTPLTEADKGATVLMLNGLVLNDLRFAAELAGAHEEGGPGFGALLESVLDRERYPAIVQALDAGVFAPDDDPDGDFAFALERTLDGVERLIAGRGAAR
jgi:hypothetical protein